MTNNNNRAEAVRAFAVASLDAEQGADMALARIAQAVCSHGGAQGFADDVSADRAEIGLARTGINPDTFRATVILPTWDAFVEAAAQHKPYVISASTVRNLVTARVIILAAGIDENDPVAFADAKRLAPAWGKGAAEKATATLAGEQDPAAALRALAGGSAVRAAETAAKQAAKSVAGEQDPIRKALGTLLRKVGVLVNPDGSVSVAQDSKGNAMHTPREMRDLQDTLRAFARYLDRGAILAAGGASVVDVDGHPVADGTGTDGTPLRTTEHVEALAAA